MAISHFLDLARMFLVPLVVMLVPVFIGQFYGQYHHRKFPDIQVAPIGTAVTAALGLLAFILAFTFQHASDRYDKRKALLLEEVTNIRTTYLRAGLMPEPFRSGTRNLLVKYVDIRVDVAEDPSKLAATRIASQRCLDTLWMYAEAVAAQDKNSEVYALFISSINDLFDNANQRVTMTLEYRIPAFVLWVLFIITFLSMLGLGYEFGISGKKAYSIKLLLATIFAVVMFLISALDHPEAGVAKLNQKPVFRLQKQLQEMQSRMNP